MYNLNETTIFNLIAIFIGILYGIIAQRKQFCFSGGIKDLILFKHTRRTASLIVAITTAIFSTQILSYIYDINLIQTRYYININYLFIILGGAMFGYGMMISDGCSSRHLIKFAQKDKESLYILLTLGIFSYITYSLLSYYSNQLNTYSIITFLKVNHSFTVPYFIVAVILLYLLYKSLNKCVNILQCWDGFLIGLIISFVWFYTSIIANDLFLDIPSQSLSFVYPLGKIIQTFQSGFEQSNLIFSVWIVFGVIIGAFISSLTNPTYSKKLQCDNSQQNPPKLSKKIFGGAMMGIGGILAVGCTVGQGLSGVSTLSFASFLAIGSIYISAYITAKKMQKNNSLIACFIFDFK